MPLKEIYALHFVTVQMVLVPECNSLVIVRIIGATANVTPVDEDMPGYHDSVIINL